MAVNRTTTITDAGEITTTTNGVATTTGSVMRTLTPDFDWRTTFDPASGVNKALLRFVLDAIRANRAWWDQGTWRRLVENDYDVHCLLGDIDENVDDPLAFVAGAVAYNPNETNPACGTAMCTAGWAAEVTRPDWVLDALTLKEMRIHNDALDEGTIWLNPHAHTDEILVRLDDPLFAGFDVGTADAPRGTGWSNVHPGVKPMLAKRGFTEQTHAVVSISTYAATVLGIGIDKLDLFNGDNQMSDVEAIIQAYIQMTTKPDAMEYEELAGLLEEIEVKRD